MRDISVLIIDDETRERQVLEKAINTVLKLEPNRPAVMVSVKAPDEPSPSAAVDAVTKALNITGVGVWTPPTNTPDLIVLDWKLDGSRATWHGTTIGSGMDIFRHILAPVLLRPDGPRTKVVIVTAYMTEDTMQTEEALGTTYAKELDGALAAGALYDFWEKPLNETQIRSSLESLFDLPSRYDTNSEIESFRHGLEKAVVTQQVKPVEDTGDGKGPVDYRKKGSGRALSRFLGVSEFRRRVITQTKQLARTRRRYPILLQGETGTGKELVARMIHEFEHVVELKDGMLTFKETVDRCFAVNCAEFTDQLLQSQLFGHIAGAFTGAKEDKEGIFHLADGGTVFLDEIGESKTQFQAMLLRFLETQHVSRLGEEGAGKPVDVRIILATDRILAEEVHQGRMRPAFYHRISALEVKLLRLRDHAEDIPILATEFWKEASGSLHGGAAPSLDNPFTPGAELELRQHDWPGNVRQLRGVIQAAVALAGKNAEGLITRPHVQEALALTEGGELKPAARIARIHEAARMEELQTIEGIWAVLDPAYDVATKQPPKHSGTMGKLADKILGFGRNFPRKIGEYKDIIERCKNEMPHLYGYVSYGKHT